MKALKKLAISVLLVASFVLPSFFIQTREATAASGTGYTQASDVDYVKNGKYVANWGARDEDCVFLTTYAQSFYTGNYVYDTLSQTRGGTGKDNAPSSALYKSLQTLMSSKQTYQTSYNATRDLFCYTDCLRGSYSQISSFYSGKMISGTWDGGKTWNREHTWPNSKGDASGNGENDIMMLRPTSVSENSSRGNKAYGQSSGYYDPNGEGQSVRGDCARILLYVYVRWGNTVSMWGSSGVIENLTTLLRWVEEDPVDTWEMGRNDAVQSITGTRNVFVDYPEYAWLLFGQTMPKDMVTPSGEASDGTATPPVSSSSSSSSSIEDSSVDSSSEENTDTVKGILDTLYSLSDGQSVTGDFTLTGKITALDSYKNPTIVVEGYENQPVYCYKLQLPDASVGDVITVTATTMKNYQGKYEFMNCTLVENQGGGSGTVTPPVDSSSVDSSSSSESSSSANKPGDVVVSDTLTLTFDDTAKRTSFSADVQVWEENGIKLTNNKASSSSNVADYHKPARFYKGSELIIKCASMGKIVFNCNTTAYATALVSGIGYVDGGDVSVNGKAVTVTFTQPVDMFKIESLLGGQVRVDSITVYVVGNEEDSADSSESDSSEVIPPVDSSVEDSSSVVDSSEVIPPVESSSEESSSEVDSSIEESSSVESSEEESSEESSSVESSEEESSEESSSVESSEEESSEESSSVESSEEESSEESSVESSEEESSEESSSVESSEEESSEESSSVESSEEESSEEVSSSVEEASATESSVKESSASEEKTEAEGSSALESNSSVAGGMSLLTGCSASVGASMGGMLLLLTACVFVHRKGRKE